MSGLIGIYHPDGRPAQRAALEAMSQVLSHRGPDGLGLWVQGPVGFACQQSWVMPESMHSPQPLVNETGLAIIFDGRLDNRAEILAELPRQHQLPTTASDAAMVMAAYRATGERAPERLNGDFAFALFDPATRRVLLARDGIGIKPLYYHQTPRAFLFASEIKALLAHPDVSTSPCEDLLADFLIGRVLDQRLTFFNNIFALLPGHAALMSAEGFRTWRYWDFDPQAQIRLGSFQEYAEAFRNLFIQAVHRRLRSRHPIAVSVSGGLDSSSIFCAGRMLADQGRLPAPGLLGVSYITPAGSPSDEREFLVMMEERYGVTIDRVPIGPAGMLKDADQAVRAVESPLLDEQWVNNHIVYERMHALGGRTVLTGHWGDQVLFMQSYLVDRFNQFAFHDVRAHLKEFNRWMTDVAPSTFARRFCFDLVKHYTPRALLPLFWRMRLGTRDRPWYTDRLRERAKRQLWSNPTPRRTFASAHARSIYEEARIGYHVLCMEWNNKVAAMHGMEIAFPMLDRDLLAFLMAIPGEMQTHRGVPRALLRESMRGILPESIAQRRWKANFTHLVNEGVRNEFPQVLDRLSRTDYAATRGYINARTLARHLDATRAGLEQSLSGRSSAALTNLLALELWLEHFFEGARSG